MRVLSICFERHWKDEVHISKTFERSGFCKLVDCYLSLNGYPFYEQVNFIVSTKTLVSKDLLKSECKASVKMSELDLTNFVGISEF